MTVPGVGPITTLALVATIGDAERFTKSRSTAVECGSNAVGIGFAFLSAPRRPTSLSRVSPFEVKGLYTTN